MAKQKVILACGCTFMDDNDAGTTSDNTYCAQHQAERDAEAEAFRKSFRKDELLAQLRDLESRIYYSQLDGDMEWVAKKMADRAKLKSELAGL